VADVLTIGSHTVTEVPGEGWLWNSLAFNAALDRCVPVVKGGIPELHFSRIVGALAALPDPWSGLVCTLTVSGTLIFSGSIVGYVDRFMDTIGWVREYRALGLRNLADYVPNTDPENLTDTSVFNLPGDDPNFVGSRSGLTVGAIVAQLLTGATNAAALNAYGIGAYTSLGPPAVLPSLTVSDLAALTVIPPFRVSISGERILQSLEAFVQSCHPNQWMHIQPDGTIRFLDMRIPANNTLTLGGDPRLGMPTMTRDYSDCYSQVEVRGNTLAVAMTLQTQPWPGSGSSDGGLQEDFAWGSLSNAAAKAAWVPADFTQPSIGAGNATDTGTCTCPSTTTVTVTSNNALQTWPSNYWAQSGTEAQGLVYLYADSLGGLVNQLAQARVVSNTALTAGGTSTLTLDRALTSVAYNAYQMWGMAAGSSIVYRKYKVSNAAIAANLLTVFPYPVPIATSINSASAALTSTPSGFYTYPENGTGPPYNLGTVSITIDPVNGLIYFDRPTAVPGGTIVVYPVNVMAFVAVASGSLSTFAPSSTTYAGTLYTVEQIERTKTITCRDWTDQSNTTNMALFASEFLNSVENVVVEGSVPYNGLLTAFLVCGSAGQGVSITGTSGSTAYITGWDALNIPVVSVELIFQSGNTGTSYRTNLQLSNRRGRYTADQFLRPGVAHTQLGVEGTTYSGGGPGFAGSTADNPLSQGGTDFSGSGFNPSAIGALPGRGGEISQANQDRADAISQAKDDRDANNPGGVGRGAQISQAKADRADAISRANDARDAGGN
jgi:hypothetical protein